MNDIEAGDWAAASLELAEGSLVTVTATLGSPQEITRHRFHFEAFSAESGTSPYEPSSEPWEITPDDDAAKAAIDGVIGDWQLRPEGWWGQFERYADALDGTTPDLPVTLADARASIELVTALYASARSGRDVELPLAPDRPDYRGWLP